MLEQKSDVQIPEASSIKVLPNLSKRLRKKKRERETPNYDSIT